jgi:hypothetical protein
MQEAKMKLVLDERIYTVDELEELWGISKRKIVAFIKDKKLIPVDDKPVKGTTFKITQSEVDSFLAKGLIKIDDK